MTISLSNYNRIQEELITKFQWKQSTHYHRCSLAETTMFRLKVIFGERLMTRQFDHQVSELLIKCAVLIELRSAKGVHMIHLAKPNSYPVLA